MSELIEKQNQIEILDITPENIIAGVRALLHEAAQKVFDRHIPQLTEWVKKRIRALNGNLGTRIKSVQLSLNAYNETAELGIQSVSVGFRDKSHKKLLPTGEFKDATIGVIASGLLEDKNAPWVIASFGVEAGNAESIYPSKHLRFDESHRGEEETLPQSGSPVVVVRGPNSARTVVQKAKPDEADKIVDGPDRLNSGVYSCEYVRFEKKADR